MNVLDGAALRLMRLLPPVIVGLACGSVQAQPIQTRLADDHDRVIDLGEERTKELGSANVWIGPKRDVAGKYLRQYWSVSCDEAMLLFVPAMHAGELILTVACKRGENVDLEQSVPEKQRREQQKVTVAAWSRFADDVTQWRVSGPVTDLDPEVEETMRPSDRQFFDSFAPLLAVYRDNRWFVLPMRVGETADVPRVKRSRWQEALIDLTGADRKKLDAHEEESSAWRGRNREDQRLAIAIRERDLTRFKRAFDELKYLPKDSYTLYQRLCDALANGQDEMVIYALSSGTPARLAKNEISAPPSPTRPALVGAMIDSYHCGSCPLNELREHGFKMTDRWIAAIDKARIDHGPNQRELKSARSELETAINRHIEMRAQQRAARQSKY